MLSHPTLLSLLLFLATPALSLSYDLEHSLLRSGHPQIGLYRALSRSPPSLESRDQHPFASKNPTHTAHCFTQPLDHFDKSNNVTFCQRYWVDSSKYKEGGPVLVLDGGETSGANRLPFMDTGILDILSTAHHGLSLILEHRYYGSSLPSHSHLPSLSTDNLRFLTNEQAELDSITFIRSLNLTHLGLPSLDPAHTPWVYYGGSYAGARAAHLIAKYPGEIWGAIASSGVVHAQVDYWEYFDAIRQWAPTECMGTLNKAVEAIDVALEVSEKVGMRGRFQGLFGLEGLSEADFGETLAGVLGSWQGRSWDKKVGSQQFYHFCDALTANGTTTTLGPLEIPAAVRNYATWVKEKIVTKCPVDDSTGERDIQACFGTDDPEQFKADGRDEKWRLWLWQVCTQWGYFMPAPPEGVPRIVSKFITLAHTSKICPLAFPAGEHFQIPLWPDVDSVNARGDFGLSRDRLALVDGDSDPWRPATGQSDYADKRNDTLLRPVKLITDAVHHFDENGLHPHSSEPKRIRKVHAEEVEFVGGWLREWREVGWGKK